MVCGVCEVGAVTALGAAGLIPAWCRGWRGVALLAALLLVAVLLWRRGTACTTCTAPADPETDK